MNNQVSQNQPKITDVVLSRVAEMKKEQGLSLPKHYNAGNALNSAFLVLQKIKGIERATPASKSKALLDMVLQGLSPAKDQCYFIIYGNELQMQRSYFGTVAAVKRLDGVKKVRAEVVHEDDEFEIGSDEDMELVVKKFTPKFENQDKPIIGAFALIKTDEGNSYTVMTKKEIDQSWSQTRQKNNKVQQNFSQEMAKRTVLNRAAKMFINTSDDSDLLTGAINDTTSNEYDDERRDVTSEGEERKPQQSAMDILTNSNKEEEKHSKQIKKQSTRKDVTPKSIETKGGEEKHAQEELFPDGTITPTSADK